MRVRRSLDWWETERCRKLTYQSNLIDVSYFVSLVLLSLRLPSCSIVVGGEEVSSFDAGTDERKSIGIEGRPLIVVLSNVGTETEVNCRVSSRSLVAPYRREIDDLRLVDRTVTETSLVSRLVQDHGVLHVVPGIRDDGDNGVGAVREVVESIVIVQVGSNHGSLSRLKTILLVSE
jgi:hypothetical protein